MLKFVAGLSLAALVSVVPAIAQDVPEQASKTLWCSIGFTTVAGAKPEGATEEDEAFAAQLTADGATLLTEAETAYGAAGLSAEQFAAARAELEPKVVEQVINGAAADADYSFEECMALLPTSAASPAAPAPAEAAPVAPATPAAGDTEESEDGAEPDSDPAN